VNADVAGIDCGAAEHYVAVPPDRDPQPVQAFSTFTEGLHRLADWLTAGRIRSVAMEAADRHTLNAALLILGPRIAGVPVTLTSALHGDSSPGVEAWTASGRVFVYTHSDTFRCASHVPSIRQCLLKLAPVIVHEAWHLRHGPDEARAYDEQMAFLMLNGGSAANIAGVHRARGYVLARERRQKATEVARHDRPF
jgi:hypothetical protein